jgi:hypothetical protein
MSILIVLLILSLIHVILNLRKASISAYFEKIMVYLFCSFLIFTILLTISLGLQLIPYYFNSIYIPLGAMMVTVIGLYLNRRLEKEKEYRKVKRIVYTVNDTIKTNKKTVETLQSELEEVKKINILKKGFWDILSSSIN